jgi:hypothetical protein
VKEGVKKLEMKDGSVNWRVVEGGREGFRKKYKSEKEPKIIALLNT